MNNLRERAQALPTFAGCTPETTRPYDLLLADALDLLDEMAAVNAEGQDAAAYIANNDPDEEVRESFRAVCGRIEQVLRKYREGKS